MTIMNMEQYVICWMGIGSYKNKIYIMNPVLQILYIMCIYTHIQTYTHTYGNLGRFLQINYRLFQFYPFCLFTFPNFSMMHTH